MVVVQLTGGLGNQMFQYAAAKSLAIRKKTSLILDISSFYRTEIPDLEVVRDFALQKFLGVTEESININNLALNDQFSFLEDKKIDKLLPRFKRSTFREKFFHFDSTFFKTKNSVYLVGIWQSPKYFETVQNEILKSFKFRNEIINRVEAKANEMRNSNSLSIHVRRGDYLRKPIILDWHGVMSKEYYLNAFNLIKTKTKIDKVYYFSDEPDWVASELIPHIPGEIVSVEVSKSQYEDFYLLQSCQHQILANSSFSWWAAYLNSNPNKIVIAPKRWFNQVDYNTKDLFPESWITI
jgi:hypothetical protein